MHMHCLFVNTRMPRKFKTICMVIWNITRRSRSSKKF